MFIILQKENEGQDFNGQQTATVIPRRGDRVVFHVPYTKQLNKCILLVQVWLSSRVDRGESNFLFEFSIYFLF